MNFLKVIRGPIVFCQKILYNWRMKQLKTKLMNKAKKKRVTFKLFKFKEDCNGKN